MSIKLNTTISTLQTQRRLGQTTAELSSSFQKLSSGLRINGASDDPAGLAVAAILESKARLYSRAILNINDAVSLLNIGDSTLDALTDIVSRQAELSEQAANGTLTLIQRRALNSEANALVDEFNRIVGSTTFNGQQILDGRLSTSIQDGISSSDSSTLAVGTEIDRNVGNGTFGTSQIVAFGSGYSVVADFNGDGYSDTILGNGALDSYLFLGSASGLVQHTNSVAPFGSSTSFIAEDFNNDGKLDVLYCNPNSASSWVRLGNGDGTFGAEIVLGDAQTGPIAGDFTGDGILDLMMAQSGTFYLKVGNGNGTFGAARSLGGSMTSVPVPEAKIGDFNGDGRLDAAFIPGDTSGTRVFLNNGNGTFSRYTITESDGTPTGLVVEDVNNDGYSDLVVSHNTATGISVYLSNGNGSFSQRISYSSNTTSHLNSGDMNGDGILDLISLSSSNTASVMLGNSDGTFRTPVSFTTSNARNLYSGDFNGDGATDILTIGDVLVGANGKVFFATPTVVTTEKRLNLLSQRNARLSLTATTALLNQIGLEKSRVGATLSKLSFHQNFLTGMREGQISAQSRIQDVDVAEESAKLVRLKILQNAQTALLAQANQSASLVLTLLGNGSGKS